jgi:hypothetical protein
MKHPSRGYGSGCSRRNFLKGAGALGLTLAAARRARGTSGFDFTGNFNACPLGPMTTASKQLAWSNPAILKLTDSDQGSRFEITTGGKNGGQCCRAFYPVGHFGGGKGWYQLDFGSVGLPLNIEWDQMFEPGFDLSEGLGKIAPGILWGPVGGLNNGSVHVYIWNSGPPGRGAKAKYSALSQVNRAGYTPHELLVGMNSPNWIVPGQWNHLRIQVFGGPSGFANYWVDGVLIATSVMPTFSFPTDVVSVNFNPFAGGGSAAYAPKIDSWARHDNVRIWSGTVAGG